MRASSFLLAAAFTFGSTAAFAQSNYNIVVEPVGQSIDSIINAPVEYDEDGVVKAQHFNADDLTEEEYQALLDEAERIKAYRNANGLNFDQEYIYPDTDSKTVAEPDTSYQVELFAPETSSATTTSLKIHTVSKGDTLYNISKRYDTSIAAIQSENGLTGTYLSIGQRVRIPGVVVESINTVSRPIFASAPVRDGYVTRRIVEPAPTIETPQVESIASKEVVYAVLPKDTLYSISRRTCIGVKELIARNQIRSPDTLTPGQRITLPVGHCVTR